MNKPIVINSKMTVQQIKDKYVAEVLRCLPEQITLFFKGKKLDENEEIGSYGISFNAKLVAMPQKIKSN